MGNLHYRNGVFRSSRFILENHFDFFSYRFDSSILFSSIFTDCWFSPYWRGCSINQFVEVKMDFDGKKILIVASDFPYPPNHGARLDIWGRILALKQLGFAIDL